MKALLEIHVLQNFAPSNLNRDDTGSPKDAYFGGVKRGRVSSQSLKRAMRMYFKTENLLDEKNLGIRTKRFLGSFVARLKDSGKDEKESSLAVQNAITAMGTAKNFKFDSKRPELTEYLFPLGEKEIQNLLEVIKSNWDVLAKEEAKVSKDLKKKLENAWADSSEGSNAVDIALFGRMLANLPEKNQFAACQVAHAISTHAIKHDEDFYTAVDDLKPDDNAGADMLGTVEFNSACYYRYAVIDLEQLNKNLQLDTELVEAGIKAFLHAIVYALPTGKQNTFAAHQAPSLIGSSVRKNASARSLANAFEKPVRVSQDGWLTASAMSLVKEWHELEEVFGQGGVHKLINRTDASLEKTILEKASVKSVDIWITETLAEAMKALRS
jgi:CRISPR system Cascade subunit CasC